MEMNLLTVRGRTTMGKAHARRLRQEGRAPAIAYAEGKTPLHFDVNVKELLKVLTVKGKNTVLHLSFEHDAKNTYTAMLRELQREAVSRNVLHADFALIDINKPVHVSVKLNFVGRPVGVIQGGIMDVIRRELLIECLPQAVPNIIDIDISQLGVNQALHIGEITLPPGIKAINDARLTLLTISAPESVEPEASA